MIQFNNTMRVLQNYGALFAQTYRDNNAAAGYDPSSELNNISFNVTSSGGTFQLIFHLPEYWKYAENGRGPGKMPPKGSLLKWMEWKHILPTLTQIKTGPRAGKTYLPSMEGLEYVIRRKIGRDGTEGSHTWELTEHELYDRLVRDVKSALQEDIENYFMQSNPMRKH